MYCEHKGTFRRIVNELCASSHPVVAVVSTKRLFPSPCAVCIFSEGSDPHIEGCHEHHCSHYGWVKNIDPKVDEFAESQGYVRDKNGKYYLDINNDEMMFCHTNILDYWKPQHLVLWRKL